MKSSVILSLFILAVSVPALSAAENKGQETQAQILEQANFDCANCFFGAGDYYFCFEANNKVMLAHDKVYMFNWTDPSKNYFGKVYSRWKIPNPSGQSVTIQYNDRHVWMPRADGKQVRLTLDYSRDIFTDSRCRAAVKKPAEK